MDNVDLKIDHSTAHVYSLVQHDWLTIGNIVLWRG
jgi:hypothetical protein